MRIEHSARRHENVRLEIMLQPAFTDTVVSRKTWSIFRCRLHVEKRVTVIKSESPVPEDLAIVTQDDLQLRVTVE